MFFRISCSSSVPTASSSTIAVDGMPRCTRGRTPSCSTPCMRYCLRPCPRNSQTRSLASAPPKPRSPSTTRCRCPTVNTPSKPRLVPLRPDAILAICRDVTDTLRTNERLATERRLEEARCTELLSLLESTLDSTADGILVVDRHGRFATFNRQFVTLWRIPKAIIDARDRDRALAFALDQLVDPEAFSAKVRDLYASPDAESFDVLTFKDGRTFERYSRPQYVDGNCVGRVWSFRDVTDRMRTEAALRESEQRFRQLAESIDQVFWLREVGTERVLYVSPAFESILGRPVVALYANPQLWIESIDPADRPHVTERYDGWLSGESTEPGSLTYRIVRPDGTIRWILDTVTPIRDPHGRVCRVGGV